MNRRGFLKAVAGAAASVMGAGLVPVSQRAALAPSVIRWESFETVGVGIVNIAACRKLELYRGVTPPHRHIDPVIFPALKVMSE